MTEPTDSPRIVIVIERKSWWQRWLEKEPVYDPPRNWCGQPLR